LFFSFLCVGDKRPQAGAKARHTPVARTKRRAHVSLARGSFQNRAADDKHPCIIVYQQAAAAAEEEEEIEEEEIE
jgi:hypothetical protein